jgi:hypothetical protein
LDRLVVRLKPAIDLSISLRAALVDWAPLKRLEKSGNLYAPIWLQVGWYLVGKALILMPAAVRLHRVVVRAAGASRRMRWAS